MVKKILAHLWNIVDSILVFIDPQAIDPELARDAHILIHK